MSSVEVQLPIRVRVCLSFTFFQKKKAPGIAKKFEKLKKSGLSRFREQTIGRLRA